MHGIKIVYLSNYVAGCRTISFRSIRNVLINSKIYLLMFAPN